jgi:large subunit ribosomal protein L1
MSKKYKTAIEKIDEGKEYSLEEAIDLVKEIAYANFDEGVDIAVKLGVDPKKSDQMVRGTALLPHGRGKIVRVLVFAKGEKEAEAKEAGADYVGSEDLVDKIKEGWLEFDKAISTPDMMAVVGKLGKILGPRGLMPNPKIGTVTFDVGQTVKEIKAGKVDFKVDKGANVHIPVGKVSFDRQKLIDNTYAVIDSVNKAKPPASKGKYMKKMTISSTMGPGVYIDLGKMAAHLRK